MLLLLNSELFSCRSNRTYVITTIMEEPYMMLRRPDLDGIPRVGNDRFEGYCKVSFSLGSEGYLLGWSFFFNFRI